MDLIVSESTTRRAKNRYLDELKKRAKSSDSDNFKGLPAKKRETVVIGRRSRQH